MDKIDKKGKIVLKGQIKCLSPLHIGSGLDDRSDMDVLITENDQPFIPATSFIGVLRHLIKLSKADQKNNNQNLKTFWGFTEENNGHQSLINCSDLTSGTSEKSLIVIRDGIKIDNRTGIVKAQGKFDYELVERDTVFNLNMEFSYHNPEERVFVERMVRTIYNTLNQKIQIGAKTNSGFGEIELVGPKIYKFNLSHDKDVINWLLQDYDNAIPISIEDLEEAFILTNNKFGIEVDLKLKNSLIIGAYSDQPRMPDKTHIKSRDSYVLPGTSLKGAIRARAERIVNTLGKSDAIIKELFGNVDEDRDSPNAQKGRIRVKETVLPEFIAELQARIKIDRFTGGTIESALFDSMPLFTDFNEKIVKVGIYVKDCRKHEAGLLLLILKDLWSGDLPVGGEKNVGRGVFSGVRATITWNGETITLEQDLTKLEQADKEKLETFVNALNLEKSI